MWWNGLFFLFMGFWLVFGLSIWHSFEGWMYSSRYDGPAKSSGAYGDSLARLITDLRKHKKLVGLAAMVSVDGEVVGTAAVGERMSGSNVPLDPGDRWHLGSITKSITATMIARLVESGRMQWTDTVGLRFPEAPIHADWKPVTLEQLLTHTAGAPPNFPLSIKRKKPAIGPECTRERRQAVIEIMSEKPRSKPGEKHGYSNVGFTIAGAMAEQATGESWEDLVKREVFEPLVLREAGFGPPKSPSETLPQPRGHRALFARKMGMGDDADNTPIMGPAGSVHMTLGDLTTYALEHLHGEQGTGKLLKEETYKRLHTPQLDDYAYGWVFKKPTYTIPHAVYWHNGSNTMWYALVVFIPTKNMVVAVTSNDGDISGAESAAWQVVESVAKQFHTEGDEERREALTVGFDLKTSPFEAVRWKESQPEVQVGGEWYRLVSLDKVEATEIIAFSQRTYGNRWRMRFEEDLVELLTRMGHSPKHSVTLVVQPLTSTETRTLENVRMTEENRRAIKRAAMQRGQQGEGE